MGGERVTIYLHIIFCPFHDFTNIFLLFSAFFFIHFQVVILGNFLYSQRSEILTIYEYTSLST